MRLGKMFSQYSNLLRDIECISYAMIACVAGFGGRVIYLLATGNSAWDAAGTLATSLSALLVARNIRQLILRNEIQRADDRQQDIVRVTHHLMVIISDFRSHVTYLQGKLSHLEFTPALVFVEAAENIISRYDVLLEREIYQFLPGPTIDIIRELSGSVLGIKASASAIAKMSHSDPKIMLSSLIPPNNGLFEAFNTLINDLNRLDEAVRQQRSELDQQF